MVDSLRGMLPPVYRPLFDELFDEPKLEEKRATCDRCAMCDHGDPSPVAMEYFRLDTKCCTFFPQLPNFLVGAILADDSPEMAEGKARIRKVIASRIGITPHWLTRPRKLTLVMSGYAAGFGRAKSLLCPFYEGSNEAGTCTVWRHRETVCMTYYCKYSDGQRGFDFWTSLKNYLAYVQRRLARASADATDPTVLEPGNRMTDLTVEDLDDQPPNDADYAKIWKSWVGREEEFYLRCHAWVRAIEPASFASNIDQSAEGKPYLDDLRSKYDKVKRKHLPTYLVRNARMSEQHTGSKVVVTTYHRFDSFALDKDLYDVVGLFRSNETLEQNLQRLSAEGIELEPALVEYLFAAGVLVEPKVSASAAPKTVAGGELEGRRTALTSILDARKIATSDTYLARIAAADGSLLDRWIRRAAVASTIEEVVDDEA